MLCVFVNCFQFLNVWFGFLGFVWGVFESFVLCVPNAGRGCCFLYGASSSLCAAGAFVT